MTLSTSFQAVFAVPLSCDDCIKSVSSQLYRLDGVSEVHGNLRDQVISVQGSAAPSAIVEAIQATGRDAILRGSGASNDKCGENTSRRDGARAGARQVSSLGP
ncbi:hypothetical protein XA68_14928 [Ophiocordyceps unilateralis]|uniref:Superoxide dismutase 1 copper chaperone n=1 Tax=Ophiocordyceps unilateralis TaxID=268505 RepID=A0A2A9PUN7_OPHUN|nr:hypothetical protein XA68_14928 [Ophiocordyceps unilateralis]